MDVTTLTERQIILQLALQEAHRKQSECQFKICELEEKLTRMTSEKNPQKDKDKVEESINYFKKCRDAWKETMNYTSVWQNELNAHL